MTTDISWGNQIIGGMPSADGALLDVVINSELGPEPAAHGILLFNELTSDGASAGVAIPQNAAYYAEITLGGGAVTTTFQCDWRGQFSVVANKIEIRARSYAPTTFVDYSPGTLGPSGTPLKRYRHGAILGYGGWHASQPITYTAPEVYIDGDSLVPVETRIDVPKFARRFYPRLGRAAADGTLTPLWPFDIESFQLMLFRAGTTTNAGYYGDFQMPLTVDIVRDGIPVGDATAIVLTSNIKNDGRKGLSSGYVLSSLFELGL
jgi:hypothetical protein